MNGYKILKCFRKEKRISGDRSYQNVCCTFYAKFSTKYCKENILLTSKAIKKKCLVSGNMNYFSWVGRSDFFILVEKRK